MRKILYIVSTLKRSGPINQLFNIIKNIDRSVFVPVLITLSPEVKDSKWQDYESLNIEMYSLNLSRLGGLFFAKSELRKLINDTQPDLIYTQGIRSDSLIATIKPHQPWMLTSRNYPFDDYPSKFGKARGLLMARKHAAVQKSCKHVIACSKSIKAMLTEIGIASYAIQNGVSFNKEIQANAVSYDYEGPVFITVGSLIPRKNVQMLIQSFNQWKLESGSLGSLVVVGDGFEREKLESLAGKGVFFVGNVDNVSDYLASADYFVSASLSEGLPNTVLEALASGLPVLLSDILPHKEIYEECDGACRTFELKNGMKALVSEFENATRNFDSTSKEDAKRVANTVFSAEVMSGHYQDYYLKILEK
ncbi:glycosyltransferase [Marinomonas sp. A79]|uniref:Glycosyltransferase n=1 Tax=Marinomonas vulgaris TaxID=2823372 RepID=A0ABS5HCE9_9GAMM|nr:glycosyltransferase [Marinomonas vulgaris]MBR7889328.1 glycosyltransferase [Marinomonas vulgaris]